jgi:hypothetical protein
MLRERLLKERKEGVLPPPPNNKNELRTFLISIFHKAQRERERGCRSRWWEGGVAVCS